MSNRSHLSEGQTTKCFCLGHLEVQNVQAGGCLEFLEAVARLWNMVLPKVGEIG